MLTASRADDPATSPDGTLRRMNAKLRLAGICLALEVGNSAHADVIAVGLAAAALLTLATARTTRRTVLGGVLLGLAVATKLTPVLAVPALLKRRWVTVLAAAGG